MSNGAGRALKSFATEKSTTAPGRRASGKSRAIGVSVRSFSSQHLSPNFRWYWVTAPSYVRVTFSICMARDLTLYTAEGWPGIGFFDATKDSTPPELVLGINNRSKTNLSTTSKNSRSLRQRCLHNTAMIYMAFADANARVFWESEGMHCFLRPIMTSARPPARGRSFSATKKYTHMYEVGRDLPSTRRKRTIMTAKGGKKGIWK